MADEKNPQRPYNWNGSEGAFISRETAKAGIEEYYQSESRIANGGTKAHYFGGDHIKHILSVPGAVGMRAYYAKSQADDPVRRVKKGEADLYLVPVDSDGNNIFTDEKGNSTYLDQNWPCPFWCPKED